MRRPRCARISGKVWARSLSERLVSALIPFLCDSPKINPPVSMYQHYDHENWGCVTGRTKRFQSAPFKQMAIIDLQTRGFVLHFHFCKDGAALHSKLFVLKSLSGILKPNFCVEPYSPFITRCNLNRYYLTLAKDFSRAASKRRSDSQSLISWQYVYCM